MGRTRSITSFNIVDGLMQWSVERRLSPVARYATATALIVLVGIVRALFITALLPWLFFMPATLLIGLTMGRRTAIYAVLLSAVVANLTLILPHSEFFLTGEQWVATALYVLVSSAIVSVASELRHSFLRARHLLAEREATNALLIEEKERTQLLNHELGHRLKNLLAIVQAVASQTIRQAPDLQSANDALSFRLAAFGRAADVLTANNWASADLYALATGALAGHESSARFRINGPAIRLNSQVALAMALAFHELATNAIKYGALSNDTGYVDLQWAIGPGPNTLQPRFNLTWQEIGGPAVRHPDRRGFGSMMIERSLRSYFRGEVAIRYEPKGVVFSIDAPLAGALADE